VLLLLPFCNLILFNLVAILRIAENVLFFINLRGFKEKT